MRNLYKKLLIATILFFSITLIYAQVPYLEVSIVNTGAPNHIKITGTARGGNFSGTKSVWGAMNITLRLPKSAAVGYVPASTPDFDPSQITNEASGFTGPVPRDAFTGTLPLTVFQASDLGCSDTYWYMQITQTNNGGLQTINQNNTITIYEFDAPGSWYCPGCVEIMTVNEPCLLATGGISTQSFIDNAGSTPFNVMQVLTNNAPLPVTILYFNAQPTGSDVKLKWTTTSEHNSKQFIVERSFDGSRFIPIGAPVKAAGNSNVNLDYSLTDAGVLSSATSPYVYYRLKVIDIDNHSGNSNVAKVAINNREKYGAILYPNITSSNATLQLTFEKADDQVQVRVVDMLGKVLHSTKVAVGIGSTVHNIDVSSYPAGMYSVQVQSTNLTKTLKLVKSN